MYRIDEAEIEAVRKVLMSRRLFRYQKDGPGECELFEREFSAHIGSAHALLVSSGTNALLAALKSFDLDPGDEVLVPAYTFVATAAAVRIAGAHPVIVNIDDNLGLCAVDAKSKITDKTKAVIPVHMDGLSADLGPILQLAKERHLVVIEDAAQAIGGRYHGRALGTWGHAGAFSLNENKNISCGEGGIVVTSDKQAFSKQFLMQDLCSRYHTVKSGEIDLPSGFLGSSMRVSEIQGAIMRVQLTRLDGILADLRERKSVFCSALPNRRGAGVIRGACPEGDCGTSLHLRFADPLKTMEAFQRLGKAGIKAYPPTMRPAHVAWKWLGEIDPAAKAAMPRDLATSVHKMACVLKYDLDPELSLDQTRELADSMARILDGVWE